MAQLVAAQCVVVHIDNDLIHLPVSHSGRPPFSWLQPEYIDAISEAFLFGQEI